MATWENQVCLSYQTSPHRLSNIGEIFFRFDSFIGFEGEDAGDGHLSEYKRVHDDAVNHTSTNRGFRTVNHVIAIYEQTKKELNQKDKFKMMDFTRNYLSYKNS